MFFKFRSKFVKMNQNPKSDNVFEEVYDGLSIGLGF